MEYTEWKLIKWINISKIYSIKICMPYFIYSHKGVSKRELRLSSCVKVMLSWNECPSQVLSNDYPEINFKIKTVSLLIHAVFQWRWFINLRQNNVKVCYQNSNHTMHYSIAVKLYLIVIHLSIDTQWKVWNVTACDYPRILIRVFNYKCPWMSDAVIWYGRHLSTCHGKHHSYDLVN